MKKLVVVSLTVGLLVNLSPCGYSLFLGRGLQESGDFTIPVSGNSGNITDDSSSNLVSPLVGEKKITYTPEYKKAEEELVNFLASDEIDKIFFEGYSYQDAINKVEIAADTILNELALVYDYDYQDAGLMGQEVIRGMNAWLKRKVRCLGCVQDVKVSTPEEAELFGKVIAETTKIIERAIQADECRGGISVSGTARRIFSAAFSRVRREELAGVPVLQQMYDALQKLAQKPDSELVQYIEHL
ncbi:MAG: hypothetical protein J7J54_01970 [Candidatus Omnitrophica bacterium]|nr:hypothetical protein [Candidatus Omnitrophota bacterium]